METFILYLRTWNDYSKEYEYDEKEIKAKSFNDLISHLSKKRYSQSVMAWEKGNKLNTYFFTGDLREDLHNTIQIEH